VQHSNTWITVSNAGSQVTISGTGFGGSQGIGYVVLNNLYGIDEIVGLSITIAALIVVPSAATYEES
jgi:hypothetical protein